jgi:hypothetical protein
VANYLDNMKNKKAQMADAMSKTDIGVKGKPKAKSSEEAMPMMKDDSKPSKYNTPRKPGESLSDFAARVEALKKGK